jgi:Carboxypeptidase regulatory-like domain/TonB-dependent Receptor Plug Domain
MNQCRVSAFARVARLIALAAVALGMGAGALLAQGSTGKIEGRVRDQAGAPIANAQVFVVGTSFNALTNPQGYYFINSVPASVVAVRAAFIGYKSTQVEGVKVLADQTITVDVQLEQTTVQLQEITVVTQTQPLVPRDEVTTKQRVDGTVTDQLPVDRINNVLALQPGVVANASGSQLSVRGGRPDENATYVDGVPVQQGFRGGYSVSAASYVQTATSEVSVGTNAFEEASVTTGSSSAEYGNAQAGIIALATRTGGSDYTASLQYETDEPFGVNHSLGLNRFGGSVGGPIPGLHGLTFYTSAALEGQQSTGNDNTGLGGGAQNTGGIVNAQGFDAQKIPVFVPAGIDTIVAVPSSFSSPTADTSYVAVQKFAVFRGDCSQFANAGSAGLSGAGAAAIQGIQGNYGLSCRGVRLPYSGQGTYQLAGKLNYSYGTGSRVAFSALRSQVNTRLFDYFAVANPLDELGRRLTNNVFTLNWTQNLSKSSERALALDTYLSYQQDRTVQGPLTQPSEFATRDKFGGFLLGGLDFLFDFDRFPINEELVNNYRVNAGRRGPVPFNNSDYFTVQKYRTNAYASSGADQILVDQFEESGGPNANLRLFRENRAIVKSNLDWQFDRYNRVKLGGEYTHYSIANFLQPFTSQSFSDVWVGKPIRWNGFVEDRLDLGDLVIVGGLRYDYFDSRALRPFYVDTFSLGGQRAATGDTVAYPRISSMPGFDPNAPTALLRRDQSHHYLSPHVQVSFPVTDRTNFRFSYSHQVQAPDFGLVYGGINTDISITNANQGFGTDLDFGRTIAYEFGIRHAFSDDMVLDVALYNKDNLSDIAGRLVSTFDPALRNNQLVGFYQNVDFGNTRGADVRLDRRFGNLFNGTIAYTYQQAKSTGSDPLSTTAGRARLLAGLGGSSLGPAQAVLPTDFNRTHTVAGAASLTFPSDFARGSVVGSILRNLSVFTIFRYASGTPFTRCLPGVAGAPSVSADILSSGGNCRGNDIEGTFNGARLPAFKQLDMRFTKGFSLGKTDLTAYLDVRNILNLRSVLQVFSVTNNVTDAEDQKRFLDRELDDFKTEAARNKTPGGAAVLTSDGSLDLTAPGVCAKWVSNDAQPAAPNCVYFIRAEQRFGNGDGIYTVAEQRTALESFYDFARGENRFTTAPRRARVGIELNF